MISVGDDFSRSASSLTTRSLSLFFIHTPPLNESSPHAGGLAEEVEASFTDPPREDLCACALLPVSGDGRVTKPELLPASPPTPRECLASSADRCGSRGPWYSRA